MFALVTEDSVLKGDMMFRMYAGEVWTGPLNVLVLLTPCCWKMVLQRVLDHRVKDGARFESKELALFVLFGCVTGFMGFWELVWLKKAPPAVKLWVMIAGIAAVVVNLPRLGRWIPALMHRVQSFLPCCVRFFSRHPLLKVETPYGESMWGGAATTEKVKLGPDGKPLPKEKKEHDGLTVLPVFPFSRVVEFEIATDELKFNSIEDMKRLGKPGSALVFPAFENVKVFDELERARSSLMLPSNSFATGAASPSSSLFDASPKPNQPRRSGMPVTSPAASYTELPLRPASSYYSTGTTSSHAATTRL